MKKVCFLFPGQGAQYPGMGKDLWEKSQDVKELFKLASDSTNMDLKELLFEGTEEDLKATDKTQIAVTLINLSASAVLKEKGITAQGVAGFSLGEYAALCEAGVIDKKDIFSIVKARGEVMEDASRNLDSQDGSAGMAAVIGLAYEKLEEVLKSIDGVYLANYNSPSQVVVSGTSYGLDNAESALKDAGARRIIRLRVSGPFHSPLLEQAGRALKEILSNFSFVNPALPIYSNVTGKRVTTCEEAKELCIKQVVSTVRWVDEEKNLLADGFTQFFEVGPGFVLSGLWKSFTKEYICHPAGKLDDIIKLADFN